MKLKVNALVSIAAIAVLTAGGATQAADPVTVEKVETISATVESIDLKKRLVSLRGTEGRTATIEVPADVRNLAQVKVGDKLVVRYQESLAAAIKPKGTSTTLNAVDQAAGVARAEPGAKPGAAVGSVSATTVVIQSVDKKSHTVMFNGADGFVRVVAVKDPAAQKFVDKLKQGDEVELTYSEALAVSVETPK